MLRFARRLVGLVVAGALVAGLPLAAARASCVCDHGREHGAMAGDGAHICTSACTADTCPMHRKKAAAGHAAQGAHGGHHAAHASPAVDHEHDAPSATPRERTRREGVSCSCAGDARALVGQATVAGVLPAIVAVAAPPTARVARSSVVESPLSLSTSPPAPPPRA